MIRELDSSEDEISLEDEDIRKKAIVVGELIDFRAKTRVVNNLHGNFGNEASLIEVSTVALHSKYLKNKYQNLQLELRDITGQEEYTRFLPLNYPGTDVALLVFAVNSTITILSLQTGY